jgi:hypothetical protein
VAQRQSEAAVRAAQKPWRASDKQALKSGNCQTVYWVKAKAPQDNRLSSSLSAGSGDKNASKWETGTTYKGDWLNNKEHGFGVQVWANGTYEGEWKYGMRDGHGTLWLKPAAPAASDKAGADGKTTPAAGSAAAQKLAADRATVTAAAVAGSLGSARAAKPAASASSSGTAGSTPGAGAGAAGGDKAALRKVYAGNWKEGKRDGMGVQFYPDGARYEGFWAAGLRHGKGTLYQPNGSVYIGDWHQGLQCGFGTLVRANQDVYEGEWLNGKREGQGIHYYRAREKVYDGEWVNDQPKCGVSMAAADFFAPGDDGADADLGLNMPVNPVVAEAAVNAAAAGGGNTAAATAANAPVRGSIPAPAGAALLGSAATAAAADGLMPPGARVSFAERLRLARVAAQPELTTNTTVPAPLKLGANTLTSSQRRQAFRLLFRPLPVLDLEAPDAVLGAEIAQIQEDRRAARNLPFVDLSQLFSAAGLDDLRRIYAYFDQQARSAAAEAARPHALAPLPAVKAPKGVSPAQVPAMLREVGFTVTAAECAVLLGDRGKPVGELVTFEDFVKLTHLCDSMKARKAQALAAAAAGAGAGGFGDAGEVNFSESLLARAMGGPRGAADAGEYERYGSDAYARDAGVGDDGLEFGGGDDDLGAELAYGGPYGQEPGQLDEGDEMAVFRDIRA